MRTIIVAPYDESWPVAFERIRNEIWPAIREVAIGIEHVGSTSVKGLAAKPIIDMNVVIEERHMPAVVNRLAEIGYTHQGDLGIRGREAFKYSGKPHLMPHHLYVCPSDSAEHGRQIAFRDYLRTHPEDREAYGRVKMEMAKRYPHDIDGYIDGKEPIVMEIYRKCGITPWK
ncbi:GrpB family protein [Eubacteriales bacterium OttesenSCG-928-A19]|nr:GrpB family protein [Eubacteriales bacterium OttesenSCG-928-A19]